MRIHNVKFGEKLSDIAKTYEVNEEIIKKTNNLEGEPTSGEELLIKLPTRSYKTIYGDTPERIALRFGIRKGDIFSLNPWITGRDLEVGETLTIKCGNRKKGMSVANGYYYKGCKKQNLLRAMPYLTYVTFSSAKATAKGIKTTFDTKIEVEICNENSKIPLLRVLDEYKERYTSGHNLSNFAEELISLALSGGFKGIVLNACTFFKSAEDYAAFLIILRKLMIGCDLILVTEINENSPIEFSEYADGSVLYYPKYSLTYPPTFDEGERKVIGDFACKGESAKVFVDLPSLAKMNSAFICIDEAINLARRKGYKIKTDKNTLLSHFSDNKQGEYYYTSLSGIRAILELVDEFDYMGICFDIMRTPLSHLMMYDSMFKTSYGTTVRSREGCSRGVEE